MPLAIGQTLSCYEIVATLGAGGMGEVYRARDTRLEREVAIEVLPEDLAGETLDGGHANLWVTRIGAAEHARQITFEDDPETSIAIPVWAPVGNGEIWKAAPLDTDAPQPLRTDLEARLPMLPHQFVLSPDAEWLAGPLRDGETTNLFKISTTDGHEVPVTDFGQRLTTIARQVSWSRDGRFLYAAVMESDADIVLLEGALR